MAENTTDIVRMEDKMGGFNTGSLNVITSLDSDSFEGQVDLYSALSTEDKLIDHIGECLNLRDYIAQIVTVTDDETGEETSAIRTVLITDKGEAYAAVSGGIVSALQTLVSVFREPSEWPCPLPVVVTERRSRASSTRRYMTLELDRGELMKQVKSAK